MSSILSAVLGHRVIIRAVNPPGPMVTALLGQEPAAVPGEGGWSFVSRPRRVGFTEWDGYDPYVLTLPILFDGFAANRSVERDIATLTDMMRKPVGPRKQPALLRIIAPGVPMTNLLWVLNGMVQGDVIRRPDGPRVRAFFTLTFLEYVSADILVAARPASPAAAAVARNPAGAAATTRTYTVKKGDSLWSIAARQLGDGKRWMEIRDLNGLRDPNRLAVGSVLRLP